MMAGIAQEKPKPYFHCGPLMGRGEKCKSKNYIHNNNTCLLTL